MRGGRGGGRGYALQRRLVLPQHDFLLRAHVVDDLILPVPQRSDVDVVPEQAGRQEGSRQ
jgi:hypothetical protein